MSIVDNVPVVTVSINGRGPYHFAIDTGASGGGRISSSLAASLGLPVIGEARSAAPGGTFQTRQIYSADAIGIGGVTISNATLATMSDTRKAAGWDGILGFDLFKDRKLSLDFAHGLMSLDARRPAESMPNSTVARR